MIFVIRVGDQAERPSARQGRQAAGWEPGSPSGTVGPGPFAVAIPASVPRGQWAWLCSKIE